MDRAVRAHANRQSDHLLAFFEGPVQGGTHFKTKFGPHQINYIGAQRPPRWQKITAGIVREVKDPMGLVDENAWRRCLFEDAAMLSRLAQGCGWCHRLWEGQQLV